MHAAGAGSRGPAGPSEPWVERVVCPAPVVAAVRAHAESAYPAEACGFLLSAAPERELPRRRIDAAVPAENSSLTDRERRFVISPAALRAAEEAACRQGAVVSGFYHSHPDRPARPSMLDLDHFWPWYVYLIVRSGPDSREEPPQAFALEPGGRRARPLAVDSSG
jgi:proteasome lid subunit RPN8/RPN11